MKNILEALGIGVFGILGCLAYVVFYGVALALMVLVGFTILNWIF